MSQSLFDEITHFAAAADPTGAPRPGQPVHPDDATTALNRIGQRRAAGELIASAALQDLRTWVPAAISAGLSKTQVADAAGITRRTVYAILREAEEGGGGGARLSAPHGFTPPGPACRARLRAPGGRPGRRSGQ